jgi:hypothetical protein
MYQNGVKIPIEHKITKWPLNIPNGHKIYQHFPFQGLPKFTQIFIFGLQIYHLATLLKTKESWEGGGQRNGWPRQE